MNVFEVIIDGNETSLQIVNALRDKNINVKDANKTTLIQQRTGILKSPSDFVQGAKYIEFDGFGLHSSDVNIGKRVPIDMPEVCYRDIEPATIDKNAIKKGSIVALSSNGLRYCGVVDSVSGDSITLKICYTSNNLVCVNFEDIALIKCIDFPLVK
jgi:hypothetical protein